MAEDIVDTIA
jgi:coiled-coil domain-containing protein 39